jgi:rhamnogalacturonan endolyase
LATTDALAERLMERLNRGAVVVRLEGGRVWLSWRLLGTDDSTVAFNVYRANAKGEPKRLNAQPITDVTNFIDAAPPTGSAVAYTVRAVVNGAEIADAPTAPALSIDSADKPYLSLPLQSIDGYLPSDASAGDLDGDGQYEIVLMQSGVAKDNSHSGVTDPPILQAYKLDGTLLWTINLGRNIRAGAHYTQFLVYDFDGDGRSELICKTADGTTDGKGNVIGDANANWVNEAGHILAGPELLTAFDGLTGGAIDTVKYTPARTNTNPEQPDPAEYKALWRDSYGNRSERYLATVAYLDGKRPSAVMCRGYYERTALSAWDLKDGKLVQRWLFDTGADPSNPYFGQGNHNLSVVDVDDDGKDEIVYGGCVIDDDGTGLFSTAYGHGDSMHVGDLVPSNPGLEMFRIQERFDDAGAHMIALKTGKTLWKKPSVAKAKTGGDKNEGPGRGVAFDIDPRHPGAESWVAGAGIEGVWDANGNEIGQTKPASCNFRIYWDGDLYDELLDRNHVSKWNVQSQTTDRIFTAEGCTSVNGTKANPSLSADLFGDWREEVIWPTTGGKELRIYTTTIPTSHRFYTLMHDPQYRLSIAWQNVSYNQPPHVGWDMSTGKQPKAAIVVAEPAGTTSSRAD